MKREDTFFPRVEAGERATPKNRSMFTERHKYMETANISEMLKSLIDLYGFNPDTLSKYLGITTEQIETVNNGNIDCLPEKFEIRSQILDKIAFLYFTAIEDKDLKLGEFLEVLISYHHLSPNTIAKMSGVEVDDINRLLSNQPEKIDLEAKYKLAVTAISLRFFLKDCEPAI